MNASNMPELPPLPLGESDFATLRKKGEIYVDKTPLLFELAKSSDKIFLARPQGFGKSLLVSTFYSLFKNGLRDFKGLQIEKLWKDEGTYSIISLDFSKIGIFDSGKSFEKRFNSYLIRYMKANRMLGWRSLLPLSNGIGEFADWLDKQPLKSVVLLIDEYDSPLTNSLTNAETFQKVRSILASFYSCLKGNSGALRFQFLTGVTRLRYAGISELNNLLDITLAPEYGDIAGFTLEELKSNFDSHLKYSAQTLGLSRQDLLLELETNYGGYCFEQSAQVKIFSPWSVLNFFKHPKRGFISYGFENGDQPSVLLQYVREHALLDLSKYAQQKSIKRTELAASISSNEIDEKVLLIETGYLTIKERNQNVLYLGYPNKEVADSMADLYLNRLLKGRDLDEVDAGKIALVLAQGDIEEFVKRINNAFFSLDYEQYFINNEKSCEGAFLLILQGSGIQAQIETHNALGRSDIEFTVVGTHWVLELKYAPEEWPIPKLLEEGLQQIKDRHYEEQSYEKNLIRLVMVFSRKERHFVAYRELNDRTDIISG